MSRQTRRSIRAARRFAGGAALLWAIAAASIAMSSRGVADHAAPAELTFSNGSGVLRTLNTREAFDRDNPFFQELGSNGRTCATCHQPAQAWTIAPVEVQ